MTIWSNRYTFKNRHSSFYILILNGLNIEYIYTRFNFKPINFFKDFSVWKTTRTNLPSFELPVLSLNTKLAFSQKIFGKPTT